MGFSFLHACHMCNMHVAYCIRWIFGSNLILWINFLSGRFYTGECYCILHALGNEKENLAVFNLTDFHNLPNRQNIFYAKFSSCTVYDKSMRCGTCTSNHSDTPVTCTMHVCDCHVIYQTNLYFPAKQYYTVHIYTHHSFVTHTAVL